MTLLLDLFNFHYDTGFSPTESIIAGLLFCGSLGILTLFAFTFYIHNKEKIYLFYTLFVLFSLIGGVINLQYDLALADQPQEMKWLPTLLLEAVTLLAFAFYCFFNNILLDVRKKNVRLHRYIVYLAYGTISYVIFYSIFSKYTIAHEDTFFIVSRVAIMLLSIIAIIWVGIKIHSPIKYFFNIGSAWYFIGALLAILRQTYPGLPLGSFYDYRSTIYFEGGILLETFCFGLAISYRVNKIHQAEKKQQEQLRTQAEYEKSLLQAEMLATRLQVNPHFIFNSLNAINLLIQKNENKRASQYLVTLSRFFRLILELPKSHTISLEDELQLIKYYINLEKNRFGDDFKFTISSTLGQELESVRIPPLLLQPFIENAVWHGLLHSPRENKTLRIEIKEEEADLLIIIEDNGLGRNKAKRITMGKRKSMGMDITQKRIGQFNKIYDCSIHFCIQDAFENSEIGKGTRVLLTIKDYQKQSITQ